MPGHYDKGLGTATQRTLPLEAVTTDGVGVAYVKTGTELSRMNNRLYRQCRNYDVSFSIAYEPSFSVVQYAFFTLPDTWFVRGAIRHAYRTYMLCMQDELNAGVKMAKWHDFHINEQNPDGTWDSLSVQMNDGDGNANLVTDEDISDASVTDAGGTSQGFHILGNLGNSYNIFREYAKLLNYGHATDPSVSSDQPYDGLLDLDDADVLTERGDRPPYDQDFASMIPDDTTVDDATGQHLLCMQDTLWVDGDGGSTKTRTRQFTAPLGLVWAKRYVNGSATDWSTTGDATILLHAKPGKYKGVHAPSLV